MSNPVQGKLSMIEVKVEQHKKVIILHLSGYLNIETIKKVEDVWLEQIRKNPNVIAFNCKNLSEIDSTSIGVLVKFLNLATNKKIKMFFYDLNDTIRELFSRSKINNFFKVTTKTRFEAEFSVDSSI